MDNYASAAILADLLNNNNHLMTVDAVASASTSTSLSTAAAQPPSPLAPLMVHGGHDAASHAEGQELTPTGKIKKPRRSKVAEACKVRPPSASPRS